MRLLMLFAALAVASSTACLAEQRPDLPYAISKLLATDPSDRTHEIAYENDGERYQNSITVQFTGKYRDSVATQVKTTAEVALRIAYFVLQEGYKPPGPDLIIQMALKNPDTGFTNTLSVRYRWADGSAERHDPKSLHANHPLASENTGWDQ